MYGTYCFIIMLYHYSLSLDYNIYEYILCHLNLCVFTLIA